MNNKDTKKEEPKVTESKAPKEAETPKMRQIVIETDGDNIHLAKAEVSGKIELVGILQSLIGFLNQPKK